MSERGPLRVDFAKETNEQLMSASQPSNVPSCPECGSRRVWKDGLRYTSVGAIQRYICRDCGYRFSESRMEKPRKIALYKTTNCRVGVPAHAGSKNSAKAVEALRELEETEKRVAGATQPGLAEFTSKVLAVAWWMKKQGYADETIRMFVSAMRTLRTRGANLDDPESVKEVIAKQEWSQARRANVIKCYDIYAKRNGIAWERPKVGRPVRKIPFIPTEAELDALIAGSPRKLAAFLQLLKETAMRAGEAKRLKWTDIDFTRQIIVLNEPEKGSDPRIWKISTKLIGMLNSLPRKSQRIFGDGPINSLKTTFYKVRKRLAFKLQNPRLLRISFHTFRHWKATMEYHKTKDIIHVKRLLGHRDVRNTEIYITIEETLFNSNSDEYHFATARTIEEAGKLIRVGFEYVCTHEGVMLFRKRK